MTSIRDAKKRKMDESVDGNQTDATARGEQESSSSGTPSLADTLDVIQHMSDKEITIVSAVITAEIRERKLNLETLMGGMRVSEGPVPPTTVRTDPKPSKEGKGLVRKGEKTFKMKRPKTRPLPERQARNVLDTVRNELVTFCKENGIQKDNPPMEGDDLFDRHTYLVHKLEWAKTFLSAVQGKKDAPQIHLYRKDNPPPDDPASS